MRLKHAIVDGQPAPQHLTLEISAIDLVPIVRYVAMRADINACAHIATLQGQYFGVLVQSEGQDGLGALDGNLGKHVKYVHKRLC
jgi:hypothetical protein